MNSIEITILSLPCVEHEVETQEVTSMSAVSICMRIDICSMGSKSVAAARGHTRKAVKLST